MIKDIDLSLFHVLTAMHCNVEPFEVEPVGGGIYRPQHSQQSVRVVDADPIHLDSGKFEVDGEEITVMHIQDYRSRINEVAADKVRRYIALAGKILTSPGMYSHDLSELRPVVRMLLDNVDCEAFAQDVVRLIASESDEHSLLDFERFETETIIYREVFEFVVKHWTQFVDEGKAFGGPPVRDEDTLRFMIVSPFEHFRTTRYVLENVHGLVVAFLS